MGLVIRKSDADSLTAVAGRERAPIYIIGEVTGDNQFTFYNPLSGEKPIDLQLERFLRKAAPDSYARYYPAAAFP